MKRIIILFVLIFSVLSFSASAHSGGTDENGGHYDGAEYHYHHGYPAHQHPNGECPYDFKDNVDHDRDYYGSDGSEYKTTTAVPFWEQSDFENGDEADNYDYFRSLEEQTTETTTEPTTEQKTEDILIFNKFSSSVLIISMIAAILSVPTLFIIYTVDYIKKKKSK